MPSPLAASPPRPRRPLSRAAWRRLRALARIRRHLAWLVLVSPLVAIVALDAATRGHRLLSLGPRHVASYTFAMLESAALWGLLLFAASSRRGLYRWLAAGIFIALATVVVGGQIYFHGQYSTYLNLDATLFGTSFSESLFAQLRADGRNFLTSVTPPLLAAALLVLVGRRVVRPRRTRGAVVARIVAPVVLACAFVVPCSYRTVQASTPDVIYLHALGGLIQALTGVRTAAQVRPGVRTPARLPPMTARSPRPRNVLFVLTESVRADTHCSTPVDDCPVSPAVNAAVPGRSPLRQLRSSSSTTAIELAVLWSGLQPVEPREALHTAPLLFEYARAAGIESAYWTSHHMMFANSRLFVQDLPTRFQCGATDLDPLADIDLGGRDDLLTARVEKEIGQLREPFFAVVHYGNTHVPYRVDSADAPFQPALPSKAPDDNEAYRNYYKNAVHLQDATIGDLLTFVRRSSFGDRTVVVFTSDHGEAFREHAQVGHTGSLYDEEIHVPGWIDAPPGTLTDDERQALEAQGDRPVFHTDVTPTILDLMGLWDDEGVDAWRQHMVGSSLLRPGYDEVALAMTNCSGIWGCAFQNWGVMQGSRKLVAREWDDAWRCHDVLADPGERNDLGPAGCAELLPLADRVFGGLPSKTSP